MDLFDVSPDLRFRLMNGAKCELDDSWNHSNVTSPFSRLYLVTQGQGFLLLNHQKIDLAPGVLCLIPGGVTCSYYCDHYLEKYFIHFTHSSTNGLNIFDMFPISTTAQAKKSDYELFDRLLKVNPDIGLQVTDPEIYHKKPWVNKVAGYDTLSQYLETSGIIQILFSRFFIAGQSNPEMIKYAYGNLKDVLLFMEQNISRKITIEQLANMACLSTDHFTRSFRKMAGVTPIYFINTKRLEKAELLLITTNLSLKEIVAQSGFNSVSFFNRMFKRRSGITPVEYKKKQMAVLYHMDQ